jgi:hypothetical protein
MSPFLRILPAYNYSNVIIPEKHYLHMVLGLLCGGKSPIWWNYFENDFYYCSDPFGNLKSEKVRNQTIKKSCNLAKQ